MTRLLFPARQLANSALRAAASSVLVLIVFAGLAGCRHKTTALVLPVIVRAPVELEVPEPGDTPGDEIASLPVPDLGPITPLPPPPAPRRRPPPTPAPATKDSQTPADSESAALAVIGTLSTGGDTTPQDQQQTQSLIASVQKRIAALPARTANSQKQQIKQVVHFLEQAQQALNTSDIEGAKTLATKAKLLLDDVEKK